MLIPPRVFESHRVASKDNSRFQLHAVYLERIGTECRATATNGKALIESRWTEEDWQEYPAENGTFCPVDGFSAIVNLDDCKALAKHKGAKAYPILDHVALSENLDDSFKLTSRVSSDVGSHTDRSIAPVEASYPDTSTVFPEKGESVLLDVLTLSRTLDALIKVQGLKPSDVGSPEALVRLSLAETRPSERPVTIAAERSQGRDIGTIALVMPLVVG